MKNLKVKYKYKIKNVSVKRKISMSSEVRSDATEQNGSGHTHKMCSLTNFPS